MEYCSSDDETAIEKGVQNVKGINKSFSTHLLTVLTTSAIFILEQTRNSVK